MEEWSKKRQYLFVYSDPKHSRGLSLLLQEYLEKNPDYKCNARPASGEMLEKFYDKVFEKLSHKLSLSQKML